MALDDDGSGKWGTIGLDVRQLERVLEMAVSFVRISADMVLREVAMVDGG
jgi:hypothetical protein